MKQITKDVYFIQGQDEMMPDAHAYLIGKPSSGDLSLIDAGVMGKGDYKIESIKEMGIRLSDIKRVIVTHTHLDHIGCLSDIVQAIPNLQIWMHTDEAEPLEQGDETIAYGMDMFKDMCQTQYGIKPGAFCFDVDRKLEGGETLEIGDMTWEVIHIPGHSPGCIALYYRPGKILIPGDTVYADYAIGRFDLKGASGPQLKGSLLVLADLEVDILLPGHNRIIVGLPAGYIRETVKQWGPYLS